MCTSCQAVVGVPSRPLSEPVQVRVACGDPVEVSYWLTRNMPLSAGTRQELLAAPTVVHRLRTLAAALSAAKARARLRCRVCHSQVRFCACLAFIESGSWHPAAELLDMPIRSAGSLARAQHPLCADFACTLLTTPPS